jgi:hypothetical protein
MQKRAKSTQDILAFLAISLYEGMVDLAFLAKRSLVESQEKI